MIETKLVLCELCGDIFKNAIGVIAIPHRDLQEEKKCDKCHKKRIGKCWTIRMGKGVSEDDP